MRRPDNAITSWRITTSATGAVTAVERAADRWFSRWTEPSAPYEVKRYDTPRGTIVTEIKLA